MRQFFVGLLIIMAVAGLEFACMSKAHASITDLKLSTAQMFDVQWYTSSGKLYASSFNYIYASINYTTQTASAARLTSANYSDINSVNGRYIGFFNSTTNPGTYGMAVFNSDGTKYKILNNTGTFVALANGAIFYNGNNSWGTLITTGAGYNLGQSGNWTITTSYPTNTQLQAYTPPSSTTLSAGQTASQYPSYMTVGANPGAMTYGTSAAISTQQQTHVTAFQNRAITNNAIYIDQVGDNNTVNITQTGNNSSISGVGQQAASIQGNNNSITVRQGATIADTNKNELNLRSHGNYNNLNINQGVTTTGANVNSSNGMYQSVDVVGSYNAVTTQQTNTGGIGGHYMETTVNGNTNNITAKQTDNANKTMFNTITGDNNTVTSTQSGTGQHYLETVLMGNNNSVTATQTGSTQNRASISITNAGGSGSVDLQQSGGANYNITTTCVTAGGCGTVTVRQ